MERLCLYIFLVAAFATSAWGGVTVSSPSSGAKVGSPVSFVASASTSTCSRGVASMGIYVDDDLKYVVNANSLNTKLSLNPGDHKTVVQEWDHCGGSSFTAVPTHRHHRLGSVCNFAGKQQHGGVAGAFCRHGSDFDLPQGCGLDRNLHCPFA